MFSSTPCFRDPDHPFSALTFPVPHNQIFSHFVSIDSRLYPYLLQQFLDIIYELKVGILY